MSLFDEGGDGGVGVIYSEWSNYQEALGSNYSDAPNSDILWQGWASS